MLLLMSFTMSTTVGIPYIEGNHLSVRCMSNLMTEEHSTSHTCIQSVIKIDDLSDGVLLFLFLQSNLPLSILLSL